MSEPSSEQSKKGEPDGLSDVRLSRIPIQNIRVEFAHHLQLLADPGFQESLSPESSRPIRTDLFLWTGTPSDFLTLICQRAVLGVEAYLQGSVMIQASRRRIADPEVWKTLRAPFSLGRSSFQVFYELLPAVVNPAWSLRVARPELFATMRHLYKRIRNPLLHGSRLRDDAPVVALRIHQCIREVYAWIDSW